jgi:putative FmdB family regulatory protein
MPIYEYRCDHCGREIEVFGQTAASAEPPDVCSCGRSGGFTRLFSAFAAHSSSAVGSEPECCSDSSPCGHTGACHCGHGHY